jgi:hypothetical protein
MNFFKRAFAVIVIAATATLAVQPAQAAPVRLNAIATGDTLATNVHYRHGRHRHHHRHRRNNNGAAIAGALIGGAIIGGLIANSGRDDYVERRYDRDPYYAPRRVYVEPRPRYRRSLSRAHVRHCYDRYRSYRAYDNTFQPYHGRRRQCRSRYY